MTAPSERIFGRPICGLKLRKYQACGMQKWREEAWGNFITIRGMADVTNCSLFILVSLIFVSEPRHSAGGVGTFVRGTYRLQCACASNGSRELHHSYYI